MLITVTQVAKIIERHPSAVYEYMKKGLIPSAVKKDKQCNTRFWDEQAIIDFMPKVREYQSKTNKQHRAKSGGKKTIIEYSNKPSETFAQMTANKAFNMCVNQ